MLHYMWQHNTGQKKEVQYDTKPAGLSEGGIRLNKEFSDLYNNGALRRSTDYSLTSTKVKQA